MSRVTLLAVLLLAFAPARAARAQSAQSSQDGLPKIGDYVYVEELPEAITRVVPVYPSDARAAGIDGTVMVQALVGKDGSVVDTKVVRSIPMLDAAAVAAVRQWRFKPGMSRGQPVAVWVAVPVKFSMDRSQGAGPGAYPPPPASSPAPPPAGRPQPRPLPQAPPREVSCGEMLSRPFAFWMADPCETCRDAEAEAWASCQRAVTLERFQDRAHLHARLESLDRTLIEMADEAGDMGGPAAGSDPRAGSRSTRYHAQIEKEFADLARLFSYGDAYERSDEIGHECEALEGRIQARMRAAAARQPLGYQWTDTTLARRSWAVAGQPYLDRLARVSRVYDERAGDDRHNRASLEILKLIDRMNDSLLAPGGLDPRERAPRRPDLMDSPLDRKPRR